MSLTKVCGRLANESPAPINEISSPIIGDELERCLCLSMKDPNGIATALTAKPIVDIMKSSNV